MFTWYWLADLCRREGIEFVLGHALYMKAIHGAKAKNDKVDAFKIATLLRGGTLPQAYVYPPEMRATRDLLRRRLHLVRRRGNLLAHIQNTHHQYNLPVPAAKVAYKANRTGVAEAFAEPDVRKSMEVDFGLIEHYDDVLRDLQLHFEHRAKHRDPQAYHRLRAVPGIGKILALTILYEIHDIARFERVQDFLSYARLVKCEHSSAGKKLGTGGAKIGNVHLKWAFSEAAVFFLRNNPEGQQHLGHPPPLPTFVKRRGALLQRALPLARARIQLDREPDVFEWTSEGTDEFLGHGAKALRSRSPIGVWCRLEEPGTRRWKRKSETEEERRAQNQRCRERPASRDVSAC